MIEPLSLIFRDNTVHVEKSTHPYDGCYDAAPRPHFREEGLIPQLLRVLLIPTAISLVEERLVVQSHTPP